MVKSSAFTNLFGRSPFKPMQEHIGVASRCAALVPDLFEALSAGDRDRVVSIKDQIDDLEQQADDIKNELRAHLPKSLLLPVDRRDLLEVLDMQDSIADTAQDIAGLLVARPMAVPPGMSELLLALTRRSVETCAQASQIVQEFDELVEAGFSGSGAETVSRMVDALERSETETIDMVSELVVLLFAHEDEMKPVSVFFWYQLIGWIGDLADGAEKVGYRVRLFLGH